MFRLGIFEVEYAVEKTYELLAILEILRIVQSMLMLHGGLVDGRPEL